MKVQWFGQSTFALKSSEGQILIDPYGSMDALRARGVRWDYPPLPEDIAADLLLVTHEHGDHNAVDVVKGSPHTVRSLAGTFETALGKVVGIASEHDDAAGTVRGANVIYVFEASGFRVCHLGDLGQAMLRPAQLLAIGKVDLLFVPVGGMATINGAEAAAAVRALGPRWVVPMHYRTPAIGFLENLDPFLAAMEANEVLMLPGESFDTDKLPAADETVVVVPAPPVATPTRPS